MRPISATFGATIRGSHRIAVDATVVSAGQTGVIPTGTAIPIIDGDVTADSSADIRCTLDLTTGETAKFPRFNTDILAPYGNEIFVRRGVVYGNTTEWVSLGYFRIYETGQSEVPEGQIRVSARDRMSGIVDFKLTSPRQFLKGSSRGTVISTLVLEVYPWATIQWDSAADRDTAIGSNNVAEQDRYGFCNDLVKAAGKIWYWDYRGILVIRDPPDPTVPVWDVNAGAGGVLVQMSRALTRDGVFNAVVASAEAAEAPTTARAIAYDNNAASPTYWNGGFGRVPMFYSSPLITTAAQASKAASSLLRQNLGLPYTVDFTSIPNPALEPLDPVRVLYPSRSRDFGPYPEEIHILDTLTIPLVATSAMTATARQQATILIGEG